MLPSWYRHLVSHAHPGVRFLALLVGYLVVFLIAVILSHLFLPEGVLRGRTTGGNLSLADSESTVTLQILVYNLISVGIVAIASLFARRTSPSEPYVSVGQQPLWILALLNGIVLGTNSFGIERPDIPLGEKMTGLLDLTSVAALWEIAGLVMISAALADKALILTTGKETVKRSFADVPFTKRELLLLVLALSLMLTGAFIEARAIVAA